MLLRISLSVEGIHDILVGIPALYLIAVAQSQYLACTECIEEFLTLIDGRVASLWVDIGLVECRTTEAVEYPPVDVLVDGFWVCGTRGNLGIVILSLVEHIQPFAGVGQWRLDTIDGAAEGTMIGNLCLALLATLGSNEDNTARSTRTVDGCRSILQYGDVLNIVAVHGVQLVDGTRYAINDDEWRGVTIDGNITTNLEGCTFITRTGRGTGNGQTGNLTLKGYGCRRYGAVLEHFLTLDLGDGRGKGSLLLLTVTYYNDILQGVIILRECNLEVATLRILEGLSLVADK